MSEPQKSVTPDPQPSGALRKGILYGLLAIMLVALAYDYRVARPAVDHAYDKITDESRRINAIANEVFTNDQVAELLGKQPAESFNDGDDLVEVYAFAGGLPIKPHKLFAVYKKQGDRQVFYRHAKFAYETSAQVIPKAKLTEAESADDDQTPQDYGAEMSEPDGGAAEQTGQRPGAGDGQRGGQRGGGAFNPEAMFAERDADGDGKLSGDEISDRMKQSLSEIDKDGDGAISKEEMTERWEERRASFGGQPGETGGPGPGGSDERDRGQQEIQRPPLEE